MRLGEPFGARHPDYDLGFLGARTTLVIGAHNMALKRDRSRNQYKRNRKLGLDDSPGPDYQAHITSMGVGDAVTDLRTQPLMAALCEVSAAAAAIGCRHCQPDRPLTVVAVNRSGSTAEGLAYGIIGKGSQIPSSFDHPSRKHLPSATDASSCPLLPVLVRL